MAIKFDIGNPARERGQAIIECVVFSFFALMLAAAACEGAKYCLAQASVESTATEAVRALAANPSMSQGELASKVSSPMSISYTKGDTETTKYTHKLANGTYASDGSANYTDRTSYVSTNKYTVTVTMKCSYMTGLGTIMKFAGAGDVGTYTVTARHSVDVDTTATNKGDGTSNW